MSTQAFETDFWKDEQLRKVWDEIIPGEPRKTLPYTLTLEAIQKYCRVVGDLHPLYFDEEYAKKSPYKGLIAPPRASSRAIAWYAFGKSFPPRVRRINSAPLPAGSSKASASFFWILGSALFIAN